MLYRFFFLGGEIYRGDAASCRMSSAIVYLVGSLVWWLKRFGFDQQICCTPGPPSYHLDDWQSISVKKKQPFMSTQPSFSAG